MKDDLIDSRREHLRHPYIRTGISVEAEGATGTSSQVAMARDLSAGGVGLICAESLQPGTQVRVTLPQLSGVKTQVPGHVVHYLPLGEGRYLVGVKFSALIAPQLFVRPETSGATTRAGVPGTRVTDRKAS